ncbi:DHH family phosphoesterase [bacterium]|nr:DHH family phosphoesterase [bacterium]
MVHWNYLDWEEMIDAAEKFFKQKLSPGKKVVLVHHGDADGVTSGLYITRIVEKITQAPLEHIIWVSTKSYKMKQERALIDSISPDILIVTDLDLGKERDLLHHWSATIDAVFMYDHHNIGEDYRDTIPHSIEYINARMLGYENIWHPASFFGYELNRRFFKEEYAWVAAIGLRGDHAFFSDEYTELQGIIQKENPELLEPLEGHDYKNLLEKCVYYVNAGFFHHPDMHEATAFRVLAKALELNDPSFIYSGDDVSADLTRKRRELKEEIQRIYAASSELAEFCPDRELIIYKIDTSHYILGVIASNLVKDNPNKVVLILNQFGTEISGEIREGENADKNLVQMMLKVKDKDFPYGSVGGHPRAAGCLFDAEHEKDFRRIFLEAFDESI